MHDLIIELIYRYEVRMFEFLEKKQQEEYKKYKKKLEDNEEIKILYQYLIELYCCYKLDEEKLYNFLKKELNNLKLNKQDIEYSLNMNDFILEEYEDDLILEESEDDLTSEEGQNAFTL